MDTLLPPPVVDQPLPEAILSSSITKTFCVSSPYGHPQVDTPRFLVTLDVGIGDAVVVGLSVVDQIIRNDPEAYGKIDVLCNPLQAQLFAYDPRINRIIQTKKVFFPGPRMTTWLRGILLDPQAAQLVRFLRERHYEGVFPSVVAPGLYFRLHARLMYPSVLTLAKNFLALRRLEDRPLGSLVRHMVNRSFGKGMPPSQLAEHIMLYIASEQLQKATKIVTELKRRSTAAAYRCKLLLVAADTASAVTRPPTNLLAPALADVLNACPHVIVCILPSYTEATASEHLLRALLPRFVGRVFSIPPEPRLTLLETAALLDQADLLLTGDTGVMHLAAACKRIADATTSDLLPRNTVGIIALFGGTNPCYYGYSRRTIIMGKGRKEQRSLRPGIAKEAYNPKGRNLFDHLCPQQVADVIKGCIANY